MAKRPTGLPALKSKIEQTPFIESLEIEGLFGKIDYPYIALGSQSKGASRVSVLFGDNGTGKTTILNLLYSALSSERNAGLLSRLAKTPFRSLKIIMTDNRSICVEKLGGERGDFSYRSDGFIQDVDVILRCDEDLDIPMQDGVAALSSFLDRLELDILFVDHERNLKSTFSFLKEISDSESSLYAPALDLKPSNALLKYTYSSYLRDFSSRRVGLQFPLSGMIEAVNQNFRSQAYLRGEAGDQNASAVYLEISRALTKPRMRAVSAEKTNRSLSDTLGYLEDQTESYIRHGLLSAYPFSELRKTIVSAPKSRLEDIERALQPFIESTERRLAALSEIHDLIRSFEDEINKYLAGKYVVFHVLRGLGIFDERGPIEISMLSSGEKQLLFLLSSAVVSRGSRSLILIDEPELSLNYRWQRLVAQSLRRLSSPQTTQFVMASHSIEIISRFPESAFELSHDHPQAQS